MKKKAYKPKHYMKKTKKDILESFFYLIFCLLAIINCAFIIGFMMIVVELISSPCKEEIHMGNSYEKLSTTDIVINLNNNEYIDIQLGLIKSKGNLK